VLLEEGHPETKLLADPSRSIVATNESPDVGFDASVNPYRGCEHGCSYCYARPTHEYLGFSAGLDFETRILVKERAPELLRARLAARSWKPQVVALSGVTDAYQPAERRLGITRRCLEVLAEFRNPVTVVTKSFLVTRDADLLGELARFDAASVLISLTTLDPELQRRMEPRAAPPARRLAAIEILAAAGVPVGVMVAPIVPGLTDHEAPRILAAAAAAGARFAGRVVLRLPHGVAEIFDGWLAEHYPGRRERVLSRVRALRNGRLYDSRFATRQRGEGIWADEMQALFDLARRRAGLALRGPALSIAGFRRPAGSDGQLALL
jgi:DNA repair photolyase